jgi:hypothetical protein
MKIENWKVKAALFGGGFLLMLMFIMCVKPYLWAEYVTGTVTEKQVKRSSGSDIYLVFFKEDGERLVEPFKNVDCNYRFKWNSSTVQANLEVGKKYRLKVSGVRNEFLSWYRNIISYKEILQ